MWECMSDGNIRKRRNKKKRRKGKQAWQVHRHAGPLDVKWMPRK